MYGVKLKIWGDYASFNRPEMKAERVSYEVITPSACRGILEAIYWKPQFRWVIDRIHVLKPIQFIPLRRNELEGKISAKNIKTAMATGKGNLSIAIEDHRVQRSAMILKDVAYGVEAHFELTEPENPDNTPGKHLAVFTRRVQKGQYFHHPYLGCREFPAQVMLVNTFPPCPDALRGTRDLGYIFHDFLFKEDPKGEVVESHRGRRLKAEPRFFHAVLEDGVLIVPPLQEV